MHQLELVGKDEITIMINKHAEQNRPVSCFINNPFIPWTSDDAESLGIPSAMLWVQSCACFAAYYHYNHGLVSFPSESDPKLDVRLPAMTVLKNDEVPSFLHPSTPYSYLWTAILVLNDTVRCDMMKSNDCVEWLDLKPTSSVIYISFETVVYLKQEKVNEIAQALLTTGISFFWVMKPPSKESGLPIHTFPEGFLEKVGDNGKIVQWSQQEKVLTHPSVTAAVYLVDVFKTGVLMCRGAAENRLIPKEDVVKCFLEATTGPKASDLKSNALKWKVAAEAAVADGGSSNRNIEAFIDEVKRNIPPWLYCS
ncbi:Limonoid UDP-glucosyltransferase [Hibiscus syriacus]|uniref:Limonoid UDP-glucosyltransferase n=1 Tax=Hibiscus syriacus TaxID=106335 RepID=A0A6A3A3C9_HIBSY|nr:Limonoid UDP-glucosyltransferase [Hibiscus syriacus]